MDDDLVIEVTEFDIEVAKQLLQLSEGETTTTTTTTTTTSSCDSCNSSFYNLFHSDVVSKNDTNNKKKKRNNDVIVAVNGDYNNGDNEIAGELEDEGCANRRQKIRKFRSIAKVYRVTSRIDL